MRAVRVTLVVLLGLFVLAGVLGNIDTSKPPTAATAVQPAAPKPTVVPKALTEKYANLELKIADWRLDGFGTVAVMNFRVKNANDFAVRDLTVSCDFHGKSGTRLSQRSQTIYDVVPAKKTKTFREVNMGFVNSQTSSATCQLDHAL